jgi:hypothetical protein
LIRSPNVFRVPPNWPGAARIEPPSTCTFVSVWKYENDEIRMLPPNASKGGVPEGCDGCCPKS